VSAEVDSFELVASARESDPEEAQGFVDCVR